MSQEDNRYMFFRLGGELYASSVHQICEVLGHTDLTPIPKTPDYFRGLLNLRGKVITVVDLSKRLGIDNSQSETPEEHKSIIIFDFEGRAVGGVVDRVESVGTLTETENMELSQDMSQVDLHFISDVGKKNENLVILLNIEEVFNPESMEHGGHQQDIGKAA